MEHQAAAKTAQAEKKEPAKTLGEVDFWTGLIAAPFRFFCKLFGTAFVKVAQSFIKMRDKKTSRKNQ